MKKKGKDKKKVIGSIGLLTAAVCCFGVAATTSVNNNGLYNGSVVRVYADDAQATLEAKIAEQKALFSDAVNEIEAYGAITEANYGAYLSAYMTAADAYFNLSLMGDISLEKVDIYTAASNELEIDAGYYTYLTGDLYNPTIVWSVKAKHDEQKAKFATLSPERQAWLKKYINVEKHDARIAAADAEFARIQAAMDAVIVAIDKIEYIGMVDSKESLEKVATAIAAVYNVEYAKINADEVKAMKEYGVDLDKYDNAVALYEAIVAECEAFDARIIATYDEFKASEAYYTGKDTIVKLSEDYKALFKGTNDNRQKLIKEAGKIEELMASVADTEARINGYMNVVSRIPAVFEYTDDYEAKVKYARACYTNELIKDVKLALEAGKAGKEVQAAYDFMCKAEADLATCKQEVIDLINDTKALEDLLKNNDASFVQKVNAVNAKLNKFLPKQEVEYLAECSDLLDEMRAQQRVVTKNVTPVIEAIEAIGEVKLSDPGIAGRINTARTMYEALATQLEKNSVTNYNKLVKAEEDLASLTQAAADWKVAVDAIVLGEKITFANIEAIDAVEATYNDWEIDLQQVVANGGSKFSYEKYDKLKADRDALLAVIATLAQDMADITLDLDLISADPTAFTSAVEAAKADFEALDATVQAQYFTAEKAANKAAYDHYVAALNLYNNVYKLVNNIIALGDPATVTMAKYNDIKAYIEEYKTLSDENKAIVDNGGYTATLNDAEDTVNALKDARDAWAAEVYALAGEVAEADWDANLYNVNLEKVTELKTARLALDNTDNGLDEVDADFDKIAELGNKRVIDMNSAIATLVANQPLKNEDIDTLKSIYNVYNTKLHKTQKDLVNYAAFEPLYNRYIFAQNFDKAVVSLHNDVVVNKNFTSDVETIVGILHGVYVSMDSEMKELIEKYSLIKEVEDAYAKFVEDGGKVLNLTATYNELYAMIKDIDDADFAAQIKAVADDLKALDDASKKAIADLEKAYKEADGKLEDAYIAADDKIYEAINNLTSKINTINSELARIEGKFDSLVADLRTDLNNAIADLNKVIAKADNTATDLAALTTRVSTLENAFSTFKNLTQTHLDLLDSQVGTNTQEIQNIQDEIDALIAALDAKFEQLDSTDKALKSEIEALRNSLTTVTVILSIVSGLSAIGVITLFVKKKKN